MSLWEEVTSLGSSSGALELRRMWPRSSGHVLLEYVRPDGTLVAGQYLCDPFERSALVSSFAPSDVEEVGAVVLYAAGTDPALRPLGRLVRRGRLVVHCPGRRAVVRVERESVRWAKVVRRSRLPGLAAAAGIAAEALAGSGVSLAPLLEVDPSGVMWWGDVSGAPLPLLLSSPGAPGALERTGRATAALHGARPAALPVHDAAREVGVLSSTLASLALVRPDRAAALAPLLPSLTSDLSAPPSPSVVLHRDLHDKQVLLGDEVTFLDLDTLALGEPELDVANLLVHLRLRSLQGVAGDPGALAEAFLSGYAAQLDPDRLRVYSRAAALRLACVYSLRPRSEHLAPHLAALAAA